jgi:hypothetical protein
MWAILDKIPYSILIVIAVFMLLAPFKPMPPYAVCIGTIDNAKKWHINQAD